MKRLEISKIVLADLSVDTIKAALEMAKINKIDIVNWSAYPYKPEVIFQMAYTDNALHLLYRVKENGIRAVNVKNNSNVWEDSCCEFFCAFDDKGYYNLETNCIGTQLLGWGSEKYKRTAASGYLIDNIFKYSTLGNVTFGVKNGKFDYQILMSIPISSFFAHSIKLEKGLKFKANFYKCGDETPHRHFLSWNPIEVEHPNFHRPDFFGDIELTA